MTGNGSWVRELALSGRDFDAGEALANGYVSRICQDQEEVLREAFKTAALIADKSPVAVLATKMSLNFSRDHSVQAGLDHVATLNASMLQSDDLAKSAMAAMQKTKAVFPKL